MNGLSQQDLEHSLDVLSVDQNDSWDDIERQYRQMVQHWHPDRHQGDDKNVAQHKFIELNTAFKRIRKHYRETGYVIKPVPPVEDGALLGTKKPIQPSNKVVSSKLVMTTALSLAIVAVFGVIVWSLDSRLEDNNRDRAKAGKENTVTNGQIEEELYGIKMNKKIETSTNEVDR